MSDELQDICRVDTSAGWDKWSETLPAYCGMHCTSDTIGSARAQIKRWGTGLLTVLALDVTGQRWSPIGEEDILVLKTVTSGSLVIEQNGHISNFCEGSMILIDPSKDLIEHFLQRTQISAVLIPKQVLRDRCLSHSLNGLLVPDISIPDVAALRDLTRYVAHQAGATSDRMRQRFGEHLIDFLEILMTEPEIYNHVRSSSAILLRAKRVIGSRLGDDQLCPSKIAAELNISTGHLNRIFKASDMSVMRYIWSLRLEQAERLLANVSDRKIQVQEIAYQCGFTSAPHFSRMFKDRYGRSPRDTSMQHTIATNSQEMVQI